MTSQYIFSFFTLDPLFPTSTLRFITLIIFGFLKGSEFILMINHSTNCLIAIIIDLFILIILNSTFCKIK